MNQNHLHYICTKFNPSDLNFLCEWFNKLHIKKWWNDGLTHEEIKDKYRKRIGDITVFPFIVYLDNSPIGFIQYYHADKIGDGWWSDEIEGTVGIDQFIGEENFIGKSYGKIMIKEFVCFLFKNPIVTKIITEVDPKNVRAKRCYEKTGFHKVGEIDTPDGRSILMVIQKP